MGPTNLLQVSNAFDQTCPSPVCVSRWERLEDGLVSVVLTSAADVGESLPQLWPLEEVNNKVQLMCELLEISNVAAHVGDCIMHNM